jgi:hypothetical protein
MKVIGKMIGAAAEKEKTDKEAKAKADAGKKAGK